MNYKLDSANSLNINLNDLCVIYISEFLKYVVKVQPGVQQQTKFGLLEAQELVGHPYGVKFNLKRGWVIPLRLTPELWTQLLPHRTQVLYKADISLILLELDIKPGSVVVESGTGSGSLSHAILRACLPHGHLKSFEINPKRAEQAREELSEHGFNDFFEIIQSDVYKDGFGQQLEGKVDACILDLPQTWDAIEHAYNVMKPTGSRLCTFSPCVEQVQMNVKKMRELNMKDIVTLECLSRNYDVRAHDLRLWTEDVLESLTEVDKLRYENLRKTLHLDKQARIDEDSTTIEQAGIDPKAQFSPKILPKKTYLRARPPQKSVSHSGFLTFATRRN